MDNHFHLFVRTPDGDLSAGMHDLNSGYVTGFNRRHGRVGPLLQGRFKAVLVERAAHDWELTRYVHLNPVRAGVVERPEAYRWGSCRFYRSSRGAPPWLAWEEVLVQHGRTLRAARRAYGEFLAEGLTAPLESPMEAVVASTLLGSEGFVARMREWLERRVPDPEVPAERALRARVGFAAVEAAVCSVFGVEPETLTARGRWRNDPRSVAIYLCRKWTGETPSSATSPPCSSRWAGPSTPPASTAKPAPSSPHATDRLPATSPLLLQSSSSSSSLP